MGRRITRKHLKENEFVTFFDSFMQWMSGNWRPFAAGLAGLVVLILLWGIASWWTGSRAGSASYLLQKAVETYQGDPASPDGAGDPEAAEAQFREIVDSFGRSDQADLYYSVFGLECLLAMGQPTPTHPMDRWLADFGDGADLDFVHLACLVRCLADTGKPPPPRTADAISARLETSRTPDGGYSETPQSHVGARRGRGRSPS